MVRVAFAWRQATFEAMMCNRFAVRGVRIVPYALKGWSVEGGRKARSLT